MKLRDRVRRWWSPAQWEDDHPAERKQREKNARGSFATREEVRKIEESKTHGTSASG
jgi:hypothetical protein